MKNKETQRQKKQARLQGTRLISPLTENLCGAVLTSANRSCADLWYPKSRSCRYTRGLIDVGNGFLVPAHFIDASEDLYICDGSVTDCILSALCI